MTNVLYILNSVKHPDISAEKFCKGFNSLEAINPSALVSKIESKKQDINEAHDKIMALQLKSEYSDEEALKQALGRAKTYIAALKRKIDAYTYEDSDSARKRHAIISWLYEKNLLFIKLYTSLVAFAFVLLIGLLSAGLPDMHIKQAAIFLGFCFSTLAGSIMIPGCQSQPRETDYTVIWPGLIASILLIGVSLNAMVLPDTTYWGLISGAVILLLSALPSLVYHIASKIHFHNVPTSTEDLLPQGTNTFVNDVALLKTSESKLELSAMTTSPPSTSTSSSSTTYGASSAVVVTSLTQAPNPTNSRRLPDDGRTPLLGTQSSPFKAYNQ